MIRRRQVACLRLLVVWMGRLPRFQSGVDTRHDPVGVKVEIAAPWDGGGVMGSCCPAHVRTLGITPNSQSRFIFNTIIVNLC
jgi:hypothetical protein